METKDVKQKVFFEMLQTVTTLKNRLRHFNERNADLLEVLARKQEDILIQALVDIDKFHTLHTFLNMLDKDLDILIEGLKNELNDI